MAREPDRHQGSALRLAGVTVVLDGHIARTNLAALAAVLGNVGETTKQNLLRMAAQRLGGDELAKRLNVPRSLLDAWMSGHASMPDRKLLQLAALLDQLGDSPEN